MHPVKIHDRYLQKRIHRFDFMRSVRVCSFNNLLEILLFHWHQIRVEYSTDSMNHSGA